MKRILKHLWATYPAPPGIGLDVGGYDVNGVVKDCIDFTIIALDLIPCDKVDIISDAHKLPFEANTFSAVWSTCSLQYLNNPFVAVSEMYRVLKPGGTVYLQAAFSEPRGMIGKHWADKDQETFGIYPRGMRKLLEYNGFDIKCVSCFKAASRCWGVAAK